MDDRVKYWIEISDYELETAEAMLQSRRFLYVGFMCHQTIEKAFKAYFTSLMKRQLHFRTAFPILQKKADFTNSFPKSRKILLTRLNR